MGKFLFKVSDKCFAPGRESGFHIVFTTRTPGIHVVADPDDDKFIACALALKAGCVVSDDKTLVDVRLYQGIRIVTPQEFFEIRGDLKP